MKKLLIGAFLWIFTLAWVAVLPNYVSATTADVTNTTFNWGNDGASGDNRTIWGDLKGDNNAITGAENQNSTLLDTIKNTIKWILGILATVAVVICLYAGFIMMTSAGDENKYKNGMKVLKYAAIWLAIILLSWLIVSIIFWFVNKQGATGVMW